MTKKIQLTRFAQFDRATANKNDKTIELSVSSDSDGIRQWVPGLGPVREVLGHEPTEVILDRFQEPHGGPLLFNHNFEALIGRFTATALADGKLRGIARFGNSPQAESLWRDLCDGILVDVSITYDYDARDIEITESDGEGHPTAIRVKRWTPYEVSFVTVPADASVGVGRSRRDEDEDEPEKDEEDDRSEDTDEDEENEDEERSESEDEDEKDDDERSEDEDENEEKDDEERSRPRRKAPNKPLTTPKSNARQGRKEIRMPNTLEAKPDRVAEILKLADQFGVVPEKRNAWINGGASVSAVRKEILDGFQQTSKPLPGLSDQLGLSTTERAKYSVANAVRFMVTQDQNIGGLEREVSAEIAKRLGRQNSGGLLIPTDMQIRATQQVKTPEYGGNLVFKEYMGFLEMLKNAAVVLQMGASFVGGLQGNPTWVRQDSTSRFFWLDENPDNDVTESDIEFGIVTATPKTAKSMMKYTRQMVLQSVEAFEPILQKDLLENDALVIDSAALIGTGSNYQPRGLLETPGIGAVSLGANGDRPTYANLTKLKTLIKKANALGLGTAGYLTTPEIEDLLQNTPKLGNTIAQAVWEDDKVAGYTAIGANQVPDNLHKGTANQCHAIIFGIWSELFILEWGALEMIVDPYTGAGRDVVRITTSHLVDVFVRRPKAFAAIKDALAI